MFDHAACRAHGHLEGKGHPGSRGAARRARLARQQVTGDTAWIVANSWASWPRRPPPAWRCPGRMRAPPRTRMRSTMRRRTAPCRRCTSPIATRMGAGVRRGEAGRRRADLGSCRTASARTRDHSRAAPESARARRDRRQSRHRALSGGVPPLNCPRSRGSPRRTNLRCNAPPGHGTARRWRVSAG